jgi:hypothetical protein
VARRLDVYGRTALGRTLFMEWYGIWYDSELPRRTHEAADVPGLERIVSAARKEREPSPAGRHLGHSGVAVSRVSLD